MKGPPIPVPPYKGTRYDPVDAWMFAKGVYGPPDNRPSKQCPGYTIEQSLGWWGRKDLRFTVWWQSA